MVLVLRLGELEKMGLIKPVVIQAKAGALGTDQDGKRHDSHPDELSSFGARWYPEAVFADRKRHTVDELFPQIAPDQDRVTTISPRSSIVRSDCCHSFLGPMDKINSHPILLRVLSSSDLCFSNRKDAAGLIWG